MADAPTASTMTDGTTIIAIKYDGRIILGADARSGNNMYVGNRISGKFEPIKVIKRLYSCWRLEYQGITTIK